MAKEIIPIHGGDHGPGAPDPIKFANLHIKVFPDEMLGVDLPVEAGDWKFIFAVAKDMDELVLTRAEAFITTVSSGGVVEVRLANITQASSLMLVPDGLLIDEGDNNSGTSATPYEINPSNATVSWMDQIGIDVVQAGTGVWGLGVILEFS